MRQPALYGMLAEFNSPHDVVKAAHAAYADGYRRMDAYSPFAIEELSEAIGFHHTRLPLVVLIGGILGGLGGYFLQYWISAINYPVNAGGKPFHSWPAFIPVTFECTVLGASLSCVLGMLALNGLPMPHHPVFNVPSFAFASKDKFFLLIEATDPKFDVANTRNFLMQFDPIEVAEVPN